MSDVSPTSSRSFNWRHIVGVVAFVGAVVGTVYIVANEQGGDQVVASVGDEELTEEELFALLSSDDPLVDDESFEQVAASELLSNWMIVEAVVLELADRGFTVTQDAREQGEANVIGLGLDPESAQGASRVRSDSVVATLRAYSELNADFEVAAPEYLCASHVLLDTEDEALAVLDRLEAGEDVGDLASDLSIDPSASDNRGDLGCNPTARFVVEFGDGARSSGGSGVVGPVQTDFGFHVIDVRSIGPLSAPTHPEMSAEVIAAELDLAGSDGLAAARTEIFNQIVFDAQLRLSVDAHLDPRYGVWDPNTGVVPPNGVTG